MDGELASVVITVIGAIVTQTWIIMYKLGRIEQKLLDMEKRLNRVEERVF